MLLTFSALISNIYWRGIVSHQQILMVWHVTPAEIIGAANAAPAAPVSTPMHIKHKNISFTYPLIRNKCNALCHL